MNYGTALSGEYGPLWRELFATRDLKVWNVARIVHDLYVEGEIHSEGFAVPQVSFDHSKVKYDLVITGEGLDPERDIALLVENGIVNIKDNLAVEDTIGCGQIVQLMGMLQMNSKDISYVKEILQSMEQSYTLESSTHQLLHHYHLWVSLTDWVWE